MVNQTNEENNKLRGLSSHSIIIYIDYEILQSQVSNANISQSYYSNLVSALDYTAYYFSKLLTIDGSSSLYLSSNLFSKGYIVESEVTNIINNTINADLILIPKIIDLGENVDAAAYTIAISTKDNRPVVGGILLRSSYDFSQTNAQNFLIMLLLHEVTHVLGFANGLFKYFQTSDTLIKTTTINGIQRTLFTGSNVVKHAKRHFGCDNIEGVELENQGGEGSAGSHWEARIMLGDYMISTDYQEIVISEISLALLEDSGWYGVNYYTGGLFRYGKGLGCNFLNTSCVSNNETDFEREFCVTPYEDRCSAGNIDRGNCYIANYSYSIPSYYQYFDSETIGGFSPADYCPVSMSYSYYYYYFYSRCDSNGLNYYNLSSSFGETYGPNSLCILSSLAPSGYTIPKIARCHKIICNYDKLTFNIDIGDIEVECPYNYEEINVDGYSGSLICPGFDRVCTGSVWCNDPLTCIELESVNIDYTNDINENEEEEENYDDNYEDNTLEFEMENELDIENYSNSEIENNDYDMETEIENENNYDIETEIEYDTEIENEYNYDDIENENDNDIENDNNTDIEIENENENNTDIEIENENDTDIEENEFEFDTEIENEYNTEIENEFDTEIENEIETEIENEYDTEIENEIETEIENDFNIEKESENDIDIENENEYDTENENEYDTEIEKENEYDSEIENEYDYDMEKETENEYNIEIENENDIEKENENDSETEIELEIENEIEKEIENEIETENNSEIEIENEIETEIENEIETENNSETETEKEIETEIEMEIETEIEMEIETEIEMEIEEEYDTETEIETEIEVEKETQSENDSDSDKEKENDSDSDKEKENESDSDKEKENDSDSDKDTDNYDTDIIIDLGFDYYLKINYVATLIYVVFLLL